MRFQFWGRARPIMWRWTEWGVRKWRRRLRRSGALFLTKPEANFLNNNITEIEFSENEINIPKNELPQGLLIVNIESNSFVYMAKKIIIHHLNLNKWNIY